MDVWLTERAPGEAVDSVMSVARRELESVSGFCTAEFPTCGRALQFPTATVSFTQGLPKCKLSFVFTRFE
jgi:hypothetical protein